MIPLAFLLAVALAAGALCQWLAWRTKLPAILYLLATGMIAGVWLGPPSAFGVTDTILLPLVSLGVAVILFEGSLTLRLDEARGVSRIIRNLVTVGVLATGVVMAAAAHWIVGMPWSLAFLFGALVSVTGPTVIVPLLRAMQPSVRIGNILRWEGILVDPIGALLAVLVYEAINAGQQTNPIGVFATSLMAGSILGFLGALALGNIVRRHWVPEYLLNYTSLALVLFVFALSNLIEHESGLLAVTVMGMVLANMRGVHIENILDFKEHLTVVLISLLFILLAARMDLALLQAHLWAALGLLAVALFIARPLSVWISGFGTSITAREGLLLSWIAPRGIVAAAVSSLFALRLDEQGVVGAELLTPMVFVIIVGTVLVQSATARPVAAWLGLSNANAQGILMVGAHRVSIAIAQCLKDLGIRAVIADDHWAGIQDARMAGLDVYYGNPMSEHAERHLDLSGITGLFLMSRRPDQNALVYGHFRPEFGPKRIYAMPFGNEGEGPRHLAAPHRARTLFKPKTPWRQIDRMLKSGAELRKTKLTEAFGFAAYRERLAEGSVALFALNPSGRLRVFSPETDITPKAGWTCVTLVPGEP